MPLNPLQKRIAEILKTRRSSQSFVGGSSVFNVTYPRLSDDIDIYAEDIPVGDIAERDVDALRAAGLHVIVNNQFYGFTVEAIVAPSPGAQVATKLEWNEADRRRFFPIITNKTFGWSLHPADLAVSKLIAAATRRRARDAVDVLLLDRKYAPLEALAIAAPGKLENVSPSAVLERALLNGIQHPQDDYEALSLTRSEMPFEIENIKTILADRIARAIDEIGRCVQAEPGFLYLSRGSSTPVKPDAEAIETARPHGVTERGAVPVFTSVTKRPIER